MGNHHKTALYSAQFPQAISAYSTSVNWSATSLTTLGSTTFNSVEQNEFTTPTFAESQTTLSNAPEWASTQQPAERMVQSKKTILPVFSSLEFPSAQTQNVTTSIPQLNNQSTPAEYPKQAWENIKHATEASTQFPQTTAPQPPPQTFPTTSTHDFANTVYPTSQPVDSFPAASWPRLGSQNHSTETSHAEWPELPDVSSTKTTHHQRTATMPHAFSRREQRGAAWNV